MIESVELKFSDSAIRTARRSWYENQKAATVRYNDEKEIDEHTRLKMVRSDTGELIGYANVRKTIVVSAWKALSVINKEGAMYQLDHSTELMDMLGVYYGIGVGPMSRVKIIFYQTFQLAN